jgi:hypothetical protein
MSRLSRAIWAAWFGLAAIGCQVAVPPRATALVDSEPTDSGDPVGALLRELEVEILASYRRETLDSAAAAMVIDPSVGLTEFGVAPDAVALAAAAPQRWPFTTVDGQAVAVVSRGLLLGMSADRTVGWSYDDVSVRAAVCGRIASVPLRIAQVWVRDSERWTLVAEHLGYAQPEGQLHEPQAVSPIAIRTAIERQPESQAAQVAIAESIAPAGDRTVWDDRGSSLAVWPGAAHNLKGAATRTGPRLAQSLNAQAIVLDGVRLALGPSRAVAIVSAGVAATLSTESGAPPAPIVARLRGTFVVERVAASGKDTWLVRMALVSAPITTAALLSRTFGVAATLGPGGRVTTTCR